MRMIADCMEGKIDMILTKSISRFARNTFLLNFYTTTNILEPKKLKGKKYNK